MLFNKFFSHIFAVMAMLVCATSCSDSDMPNDSLTPNVMHEVKLTFDLGLDARLSTRAVNERLLESTDNWQMVNSMRVYLFRSDTETGTYTYYRPTLAGILKDYLYISDFEKSSLWGDDEQEWEKHTYTMTGLSLATGWYKFVAIGRDDIDGDDDSTSKWNFTVLTEGTTRMEDLTATITSTAASCNELFVGSTGARRIEEKSAFYETIILSRVVAGVLMYVENIQSEVSGTAVSSIGIIRRLHTWSQYLINPIATGTSAGFATVGEALINKVPALSDYVIKYDIPTGVTSSNGYYINLTPTNSVHPNSIVRGAFVAPQDAPTDDCTLNLVLCDGTGKIIKCWDIKLVETDGVAVTPTKLYPLEANHIYQIGRRNIGDGTDEPIDLGEMLDDVIIVHGSWQADVDIDM